MQLEHANITVPSIEKAMKFLSTVFPEFRVRGEGMIGEDEHRQRWLHFGTDNTYIALGEMVTEPPHPTRHPYFHPGINHLCYEVDNVDEIEQRLKAAGYPTRFAGDEPFRKRIYADDNVGDEWEFVQYFSQDPAKKNLYL